MKYNIIKDSLNIQNNLQLENSIERLLKHCKNKNKFKKVPFLTSIGGVDNFDYSGKSIKRSKYLEKVFKETIFINSTAAGSSYSNCIFNNCRMENANFQECTFSCSNITNNSIENSIINCNFNNSLFVDGFCIEDTYFAHSVFQGTAFIDGVIKDTTFFSSTLQDTFFSNIYFENVCFSDLNIDYSFFNNIEMLNVILPFSQVCYTFGILPYLLNTKDKVYITSSSNSENKISIQEFLQLLPDFENYYMATNEFFPLANIYLATNEISNAKKAILNGILISITNCDFRQIKYLSKLIYTYSIFDFHQRKQIYDYINEHISFFNMNSELLYKYNAYINEINYYLLNNSCSNVVTCEIDIITDVYPEDSIKLGMLLSTIEQVIEQGKSKKGEHNILCRHNSAEEILITIHDIYQALETIVPTIYSVLLGIMILDEKWKNYKKYKVEEKKSSELKELELEEKRIDVALKRIAYEKEKADYIDWKNSKLLEKNYITNQILRKNITDNAITIKKVNHIMHGDIPPETDKKIIQYSHKISD